MKKFYLILTFSVFCNVDMFSQDEIIYDPGNPCMSGYTAYYRDADGDGYGAPDFISCLSSPQSGFVLNNTDCNDFDASINPRTYWYRDADGDGAGDPNIWKRQCLQPVGYVLDNSDCDDSDATVIDCSDINPVAPSDHSFESGFSPWVQDNNDDLDWTRKSGGTPSSGTGPVVASEGSYYIFTESSGNYSKTFDLISPLYSILSGYEFTFDYHMYGSSMGSLKVLVSTDGGANWIWKWYMAGDQGSQWRTASVDLTEYQGMDIKLKFSAITGNSYTSDIAVDNLKFISTGSSGGSAVYSDENYVFKRIYKNKFTVPIINSTTNDVIEEITYLDGLGRPMQHIGIRQAANTQEDIVTHIGYDFYGRENKKYLPFPASGSNAGEFRSNDVIGSIKSYYHSNYAADFPNMTTPETNPYSETRFEASPLNRPLEQGAPGAAWKVDPVANTDRTVKFDYKSNAGSEVRLYRVSLSSTFSPSLVQSTSSYYAAGELHKSITKDENWTSGLNNTTEEFKDKQGKVVLKRTYNAGDAHDTYYVYDDYGNLTYVIPPKVVTSDGVSTTELNELCYQYHYDKRNRLIRKKIPGKGTATNWESIVYNDLDQPILTQDPNLKAQGKWLYTKYDAFGRVIATGLHTHSASSQSVMQGVVDNYYLNNSSAKVWEEKPGSNLDYSNQSYPTTNNEVLTLNFYDNYHFSHANLKLSAGTWIFDDQVEYTTQGLATGSRVKVLDQAKWITTVNHYNKEGRSIYMASYNDFLQTTDKVKTQLDFMGNVLKTETNHKKGTNTAIVTTDNFTYDHVNRLTKHTQTLNGRTEVIAANNYDKLGQLKSKGVGNIEGGDRLQDVDYTYNIRGWLKGINNESENAATITLGTGDLFGFQINYDKPTDSNKALFNGNISQTLWRSKNVDQAQRSYLYTYDAMNRITRAISNDGKFDLGTSTAPVTYDKNGNILTLQRKGAIVASPVYSNTSHFGVMDNLTYTYDGVSNRLKIVSDTGKDEFGFQDDQSGTIKDTTTDFTYDINGNMKTDTNKGITGIVYNHLNLPKSVSIGGGTISYIYDGTGVKQQKKVGTTTTDYAGNYIYKNNVLQFFNHAEGYVDYDSGSFNYVYQYKDHLGNIRLSYTDINQNNTNLVNIKIADENNYYPFGLLHKGYNSNPTSYGSTAAKMYKFGGKELQDETIGGKELDWYDFHARNYDAALGRWMNIDPLAEQMPVWSPYNFTFNNPLRYVDPLGLSPDDIIFNSIDKDGNKTELGRIVTDKFDQEINIDQNLMPFEIPENYEPVNVDLDASEIASSALETTGIQAFSLDVSGEAAFKFGAQLEVSLIGIVAGKNKGDWGITLQGNGLLGLEGSVTGSASAYWPISNGDLSLDQLRGFEYGVQGSVFGAAGSYFEGFEFTASYPFANRVYGGASLGGSLGIPELGGSGSGYIGVSDFLYRSDK